jgi:hypothetical protein
MDVAARWIFSFGSSLQLFTAHPRFLFAGPTFVWFINIISDKKLCLRFLLDFLINAFHFSSQFGAPAVVRVEFPTVITCIQCFSLMLNLNTSNTSFTGPAIQPTRPDSTSCNFSIHHLIHPGMTAVHHSIHPAMKTIHLIHPSIHLNTYCHFSIHLVYWTM